jgi:hypothetical protein
MCRKCTVWYSFEAESSRRAFEAYVWGGEEILSTTYRTDGKRTDDNNMMTPARSRDSSPVTGTIRVAIGTDNLSPAPFPQDSISFVSNLCKSFR